MRNSREGDFPYLVYKAALERNICGECETGFDENDPWEVHHIIFLASVAAKQFPLELLRSLENAELVHQSCHHHIHNVYDEPYPLDVEHVVKEFEEKRRQFKSHFLCSTTKEPLPARS